MRSFLICTRGSLHSLNLKMHIFFICIFYQKVCLNVVHQSSHRDWKTGENGRAFYQTGKSEGILFRLEKSGNFTQNTGKVWKRIKLINCKNENVYRLYGQNIYSHSAQHTCPNLHTFKCHFNQQSITH